MDGDLAAVLFGLANERVAFKMTPARDISRKTPTKAPTFINLPGIAMAAADKCVDVLSGGSATSYEAKQCEPKCLNNKLA